MATPFSEELKQQWKEKILEQRKSKLSIASWCRKNGIAVHRFYYWQGRLFPSPSSQSDFVEIIQKEEKYSEKIILEYRGFNIHLTGRFDPSILKNCLEVLKTC